MRALRVPPPHQSSGPIPLIVSAPSVKEGLLLSHWRWGNVIHRDKVAFSGQLVGPGVSGSKLTSMFLGFFLRVYTGGQCDPEPLALGEVTTIIL